MAKPIQLTDDAYENEVLKSPIPVIMDFGAAWCGPCKLLDPIMEEIAAEFDGKIKVCKVDVDQCPETAIELGIRSNPTIVIIKGGKVLDRIVGAVPKKQIVDRLHSHVL